MKKILEVLQDGEKLVFETDVKPTEEELFEVASRAMVTMAFDLWGGNEGVVLAVIRALAVADLSLCVDREQIIRSLDEESLAMAKSFSEAQRELEKAGGKVMTFYPERHSSKLPN